QQQPCRRHRGPAGRLVPGRPQHRAGLNVAAPTLARKPIASLSRSHADPTTHVDWALLVAVAALAGFGLLAIFTARYTSISLAGNDTLYYVKRQGVALAVGVVLMVGVMLVDYRKVRELALVAYLGTIALLVGVLVRGKVTNGAQAWFQIGPFQLQPSELAKVTLVLVLAAYLSPDRTAGVPFPRLVLAPALV